MRCGVVAVGCFLLVATVSASVFSRHYQLKEPLTCEECSAPKEINLSEGPDAFLVTGLDTQVKSYAGFFKTDQQTDNNMFWWYFPAQDGNTSTPIIIWLQGGPGGSSMFGLFSEMGPFELTSDLTLKDRPTSWNKKYGMLFIDNPVGAGFSFTTKDAGYCTNTKTCVAQNLYSLLQQFYTVFPEQLHNGLYITGESYAGHYVPAISYYIHTQNQKPGVTKIPLRGVAVGDGWVHPVEQIKGYPELMYNLGLANTVQRQKIQFYCDVTVTHIEGGNMTAAFEVWDQMLNGDLFPYPNYFHNITGSNNYDNFMMTNNPESFGYYGKFLNQKYVREALHVGNAIINDGSQCEKHLVEDFMASFIKEIGVLMDNYPVLIYSGQLDVIIAASLTERYVPLIKWSGQALFNSSPRKVWRINSTDQEVAGFVRQAKNFQQIVVRGAGHIVPYDQPERALDMITRFVEGIPYEDEPNPVPADSALPPRILSALVPN